MGRLTLVQHADPQPDWPEYGYTFQGEQIRLADVEKLLPVGDARAGVYYWHPTKHGVKVWPWKESVHYVDEDGHILTAAGPLPMPLAELRGLGLTDEQLFAEHAAYYREPALAPHPHADPDSLEAQQLRRRVYDEVTAAWYGDMPRLRTAG